MEKNITIPIHEGYFAQLARQDGNHELADRINKITDRGSAKRRYNELEKAGLMEEVGTRKVTESTYTKIISRMEDNLGGEQYNAREQHIIDTIIHILKEELC